MNLHTGLLHDVVQELIDENPFACRALLQVVSVEWSTQVPTAAVSCGARPRLFVNPGFVQQHCRSEAELKALLCHEFLHVLLRHTGGSGPRGPAQHIAWDAVINAIIHRTLGPAYSALMQHYYARETGVRCVLRPPREGELAKVWQRGEREGSARLRLIHGAWAGLYQTGRLVADDIETIALDLEESRCFPPVAGWLGEHGPRESSLTREPPIDGPVREALERALASMNGSGIWRSPHGRGVCAEVARVREEQEQGLDVMRWRNDLLAVLRRHLTPDPRAARNAVQPASCRLPVLGAGDRRAFARALWDPLIPEVSWEGNRPARRGSAQVYLDVSGSMDIEMPHVVALLACLGTYIRRPFWAFSDIVAPARIEQGRLIAGTTGGTQMGCVLEHIARTRPEAAVVLTDGYIERLGRKDVKVIGNTRLHAIVTRSGSTHALGEAGIPCTQLRRFPA